MRSLFGISFLAFGALLVLYFSWINSPRLGYNQFVPEILARWADKHENDNIRTAIPLLFLGLISGLYLLYKRLELKKWLVVWFMLSVLVVVAELGQFLLPLRSPDWKDVNWGIIGATCGLMIACMIKLLSYNKEE